MARLAPGVDVTFFRPGAGGAAVRERLGLGRRPVVAHDAKSLGEVPDMLAHDTEIAARKMKRKPGDLPIKDFLIGTLSADIVSKDGVELGT